jgi:hypothetical protein
MKGSIGCPTKSVTAEAHDAHALFIFDDGTIRGSGGALDVFTLTSASFQVIPE